MLYSISRNESPIRQTFPEPLITKPVDPVNGQDERALPAVDSPPSFVVRLSGGEVKKVIDEDMRQRISLKLLEALPGFPMEQR